MSPDLTDNARQEIAYLSRIAADPECDPVERAQAVLIVHQSWDAGGCLCGWSRLGKSHARHQADMLAEAGLLVPLVGG